MSIHFVEARLHALEALRDARIASIAEKVCLIVDLQGRLRVLAKPIAGKMADEVHKELVDIVAPAADVFWGDEVWIEEERATTTQQALFKTAWGQARPEQPGETRVFVLDRRLSKDAWLHSPFEPPWPLKEHTPPVVSFYSFKGGVGRTTGALALAVNLARRKRRVVVLDFDLEAPGAGCVLAPSLGPPAELGVVDYLLEAPVVPHSSLDLADFYHTYDVDAAIAGGEPIHVVPAGRLDAWYLEKLARINYEFLYRSAAEPSLPQSPLHGLLRTLRAKLRPDLILIDSRAGLHDLGGISLSGLAHLQVLFGLNTRQSWDGLSLVISHLGKEMVLSGCIQRDCAIVHAFAPPTDPTRADQVREFRERSFEVFCANYYDSAESISAEWPVPDPEALEAPHFPAVITRNDRLAAYSTLAEVADLLCEGEYRELSAFILEKVGRSL